MISIVTATYNREELLHKLYESLTQQTCQDFEWIVVDDGSHDNTLEVLSKFHNDDKININYFHQYNSGKHVAINNAVKNSKHKFVFIVDSDDHLPEDAIKKIKERIEEFNSLPNSKELAGICFLKGDNKGKVIGSSLEHNTVCNYLDYRYRHHITGDKAEVFRRKILLEFPFPEYKDEKFCPEALIWNRIAKKYNMYFCNDTVYHCEYLQGGQTDNIYKIRKESPKATLTYYYELYNSPVPYSTKVKSLINYWRFYYVSSETKVIDKPKSYLNIILKPSIKLFTILNAMER